MSNVEPTIRHDMYPDRREEPQYCAIKYLDRFLLYAFTAFTKEEVKSAEWRLSDIQQQCLTHTSFLSELESFYRSVADQVAYEVNEDEYTNLIRFIADIGSSLAGVSHQLGFRGAISSMELETEYAGDRRESSAQTVVNSDLHFSHFNAANGRLMVRAHNFPGGDADMSPAAMEKMAQQLLKAANEARAIDRKAS